MCFRGERDLPHGSLEKLVDLLVRLDGRGQLGFFLTAILDRPAHLAGRFSPECLEDRAADGSVLRVFDQHPCPGDALQDGPMPAGDGKHRQKKQWISRGPQHVFLVPVFLIPVNGFHRTAHRSFAEVARGFERHSSGVGRVTLPAILE